jgi:hypothetical protein
LKGVHYGTITCSINICSKPWDIYSNRSIPLCTLLINLLKGDNYDKPI